MSLRFQRLVLILITIIMLGSALLLILFNTKKNIVFFYTPTELLENNIELDQRIRIGGYVKKNSLIKKLSNKYEFKITDNENELIVTYQGILPDLFREGQGTVVEGLLNKTNNIIASKVYAKHDENYMPASIKKKLEKNNQWKKNYK
jgi:cytochrome c-type biogenesis protein CcmE